MIRHSRNLPAYPMLNFSSFPFRQKVLIGLYVLIGLLLIVSVATNLLKSGDIKSAIFFYGFGFSFWLLVTDAFLDLNNMKILAVWLVLALLTFIIGLVSFG